MGIKLSNQSHRAGTKQGQLPIAGLYSQNVNDKFPFIFVKVKGHSTGEGNEEADQFKRAYCGNRLDKTGEVTKVSVFIELNEKVVPF